MTPLVAVAHGSRDPRSARMVAAAVAAIQERRPDLDVRLCFLDLNAPSVDQVLDAVATEGHDCAVVVPLLLGSAFHARVDLPALLDRVRSKHPALTIVQSDVLGRDVRLLDAVRDRIVEAGCSESDEALGVAFAAVGSSDENANARTRQLGASLAVGTNWVAVETCFATAAEPGVAEAIDRLRAAGAQRVVIAPWFLAPGLLTDRLGLAAEAAASDFTEAAASDVTFAAPIGAHAALVDVVLERFDEPGLLIDAQITLSA